MGIDIRLPQITGASEREQLTQVKSYLYQLAQQLQWALKNIDTTTTTVVTPTPKSLVSADTQTEVNAKATFNSIKALIIKSADIVNSYYEEINKKLESIYVASSDFGDFKQQMEQEIIANSESIEQAFTNLQEIASEVVSVDVDLQGTKADTDTAIKDIANEVGQLDDSLREAKTKLATDIQSVKSDIEQIGYALIEVNANIRSGLLYYNDEGVPVYGLEIGQRNSIDGVEVFNKFARYTADRLSFYDQNDTEVAYISDYKIHITHAEVTGTLKLGGYLIDTTKGLTFKWVGRS